MPKKLSDMVLDEVSAVPDGANEDANMVIIKARKPNTILKETDMPQEERVEDVNDDEVDNDEDFEIDQETYDAAAAEIEELNEAGDLIPAFIAMQMGVVEAAETIGKMAEAYDTLDADHSELKKSAAQLVEKIAKERGGEGEDDLVSAVRKSLGGAELDPAVERRLTAVEAVNKERDEKEAIAKAKEFGIGKAEEVGPLLLRVRKGRLIEGDAAKIEALLKQAGVAIKKAPLLRPAGVDATVDADSPIAKAKQAADEIRKATPTLTEADALAKAFEQNPELYDAYLVEHRAKARAA